MNEGRMTEGRKGLKVENAGHSTFGLFLPSVILRSVILRWVTVSFYMYVCRERVVQSELKTSQ